VRRGKQMRRLPIQIAALHTQGKGPFLGRLQRFE
jgi:hypothetical protein